MTVREAYYSAVNLQKRMPELEHIIMQDAEYAYDYALNIIKSRWLEAESVILSDAYWSSCYAIEVMQERWIEAEENIAKSDCAPDYTNAFFDELVVTKDEVDIIQWERMNLTGYFAPASLFEDKVSLLDMVMQ